jgi:hypothetical protein
MKAKKKKDKDVFDVEKETKKMTRGPRRRKSIIMIVTQLKFPWYE